MNIIKDEVKKYMQKTKVNELTYKVNVGYAAKAVTKNVTFFSLLNIVI